MQHYLLELDYNSDPWERQYVTLGVLECTEEKGVEMVNVINEWIKKTAQEHPLEPDFGAGEWTDEDDVKVENWRQVCDDFRKTLKYPYGLTDLVRGVTSGELDLPSVRLNPVKKLELIE